MKVVVALVTNILYFLPHSVLLDILKTIIFLKPIRTDVARQLPKLNYKERQASPRRDRTHTFSHLAEHREVAALQVQRRNLKKFTFLVIVN